MQALTREHTAFVGQIIDARLWQAQLGFSQHQGALRLSLGEGRGGTFLGQSAHPIPLNAGAFDLALRDAPFEVGHGQILTITLAHGGKLGLRHFEPGQ